MKTIKKYLEGKGFHYKFDSSELDIIIDVIKEVKELTIRECSDMLNDYGVDDNNVLLDEIKLGYIKI